MASNLIPDTGFLRISQILGDSRTPPLIPVSKSTWWAGVRTGRFPKPIKLGVRTTVWRVEDIVDYIKRASLQLDLFSGDKHGKS